MKRLIGTFMASGLLASGAALAAASPSSAMPDNHCLDQQHYDEAYTAAVDKAFTAFDDYQAWVNPTVIYQGGDSSVYIAYTSQGTEIAPTYTMYQGYLNDARHASDLASEAVADFPDLYTVCEL